MNMLLMAAGSWGVACLLNCPSILSGSTFAWLVHAAIYIYMTGSQAWPVFFHAVANDRFEYTSLDEQVDNYIDFIWIVVNDIRAQFNTLDTVVMLYLLRKLN